MQVVLVTTRKWDYAPLMYEGLHFVYEGRLVDAQVEGQTRNFIMRLDYPNRKFPVCVQVMPYADLHAFILDESWADGLNW